MRLKNFLKTKKLILINTLLVTYVFINLIGGERGLISYYEKKEIFKNLKEKQTTLTHELESIQLKNKLLSGNVDLDYLDILYRDNLKYGKKDEILIKLR